jgi:hypothetical protein
MTKAKSESSEPIEAASLDDLLTVLTSINELLKLQAKHEGYALGMDPSVIV